MSQDTSSGKKGLSLPFKYENEQDYINRQSERANQLIRWFIIALAITALLYFAFHLWLLDPSKPMSWYAVRSDSARSQRALDWLLWSLAGTLVYLLVEAGYHYTAIQENAKKGSLSFSYPVSFIEKTPWNLVTLVRGPIIAVVILFFFNAGALELTGPTGDKAFSFVFSELDHPVTLLLAFVLGFYSRVAREVLNGIVKTLFAKAWAEAYGDFKIEPSDTKVVLGETMVFKTTPATEVVWAASLGTIDATGKYTAPKEPEHCGKAVITAVSTGTQSLARSATVTLVPFEITGPTKVELGEKDYTYGVTKKPDGGKAIEWSISPDPAGGKINSAGVYTTPAQAPAGTDKVTITATIQGTDCRSSLEVTLVAAAAAAPAAPEVKTADITGGDAATGKITVTITGSGFADQAEIELRQKDKEPIKAEAEGKQVEAQSITCAFKLKAEDAGDWELVVINPPPDGKESTPFPFKVK
jgi:hypothetical protein